MKNAGRFEGRSGPGFPSREQMTVLWFALSIPTMILAFTLLSPMGWVQFVLGLQLFVRKAIKLFGRPK